MKKSILEKGISYSKQALLIGIVITGVSCSDSKEEAPVVVEEIVVVEPVIIEEEIWVIDEHQFDGVALTSNADVKTPSTPSKEPAPVAEDNSEAQDEMLEEEYEIVTSETIEADLLEQEYEALASTIEVTEIIVPLEETQTVVSYAKKDKNNAAVQVVTNLQTGEVEQITFMDAKHVDVYDVQAGMSGKDVRKLRKEMKHMVKKGQVFLYDDQSNIMYLMDAQNMVGDEITIEEVETMDVQAVIWKDKKHHKKNHDGSK